MRSTLRGYYALLALATMVSKNGEERRFRIEDIAKRHPIPEPYLLQIFQDLKKSGLVKAKRGAHGGYVLAKPAREITLTAVIESVEGPILPSPLEGRSENAERPKSWKALDAIWGDLREGVRKIGSEHTLVSIAEKLSEEEPDMYYI